MGSGDDELYSEVLNLVQVVVQMMMHDHLVSTR